MKTKLLSVDIDRVAEKDYIEICAVTEEKQYYWPLVIDKQFPRIISSLNYIHFIIFKVIILSIESG